MKNIMDEETLSRELVHTLDPKQHGAFREAIKRKSYVVPTTLNQLVDMATDYGIGPSTGLVLVDTPGREKRRDITPSAAVVNVTQGLPVKKTSYGGYNTDPGPWQRN
jgi:hypothetical protein